ncbi:hypothetical protein E1162_01785 [Rhodobacteraceae bacterium RKSG542]|uniref:copper resistance D family protein n=1 Tax=Pseudovibrio flavus TaxID=2529854 RepID=UPI0012BCC8ED|nr:CopD family protein [Pseudovibrio flavus]MTI15964.1 hypothetical protein [Pseudovibrio flavus]
MAMLEGLWGWSLVALAQKTLLYYVLLTGAGTALFLFIFDRLEDTFRGRLRWVLLIFVVASFLMVAAQILLEVAYLGGWTLNMEQVPMFLGYLMDGPIGHASVLRMAGATLLLAIGIRGPLPKLLALLGVFLIAVSFSQVGHTLGEPRLLLAILISLHVLFLSYWIGAFIPLYMSASRLPVEEVGLLAERFGRIAVKAVLFLAVAGGGMLYIFTQSFSQFMGTTYGQLFVAKLVAFILLLALAGLNKLRLTPRIKQGDQGALDQFRYTILMEVMVVVSMLVITASATTLSSPM